MSVWQPCALALSTSIMLTAAVSAQDYAEFRFRHSVQNPDLNTYESTCSEARGLVQSEGILVLDIAPHRFGRFVESGRFCSRGYEAQPAWVPPADSRQF